MYIYGHSSNRSTLVKNKDTFYPPRNRNKTLDIVVDFLNNQKFDNTVTKNKSNISKSEWEATKSLKENDSIIIKEADKGGAVVVMNKSHYYNMIIHMFQHSRFERESPVFEQSLPHSR